MRRKRGRWGAISCLCSSTVHVLLRQGEGQKGRKRLGQQPSHMTSGSACYIPYPLQSTLSPCSWERTSFWNTGWISWERSLPVLLHKLQQPLFHTSSWGLSPSPSGTQISSPCANTASVPSSRSWLGPPLLKPFFGRKTTCWLGMPTSRPLKQPSGITRTTS
jgi:hypothetical protein